MKSATADQVREFNMDIQALQTIKDQLQTDIQNKHMSIANMANQLAQMRRDVQAQEMQGKLDVNRRMEEARKLADSKENALHRREVNVEAGERHLSQREAQVKAGEEKLLQRELACRKIQETALEVERARKEVASLTEELKSRRAEVESQIAIARSLEENASLKLKEAQAREKEAMLSEHRWREHRRVVERERVVVEQARAAVQAVNTPIVPEPITPLQPVEEKPAAVVPIATEKRKPGRPRKNA